MKKSLISTCLLLSTNIAFAVDYSLCSKFLADKTNTHFKINEKGEIDFSNKDDLNEYTVANKGKKLSLKKSWSDKKDKNLKSNLEVTSIKNKEGEFTITSSLITSYESLQYMPFGHYGAAPGINYSLNPQLGYATNYQKLYNPLRQYNSQIKLKIKNEKCYPETISNSSTSLNTLSNQQFTQPYNSSSEISSKKCRDILDFYKRNPKFKNCSNIDRFKELKKIIGYNKKTWHLNSKLMKEIEDKLSEVQKLTEASTLELKKCENAGLADTIKNDELWTGKSVDSSASTDENKKVKDQ